MESVLLLIYNLQHQIILQKRSPNDDSYPNTWDFSVGGDLEENEDPKIGVIREAREEIGIEITPIYFTEVKSNDGTKLHIYTCKYDGKFSINPTEVAELKPFTAKEISLLLEDDQDIHPELKFALTQYPDLLTVFN